MMLKWKQLLFSASVLTMALTACSDGKTETTSEADAAYMEWMEDSTALRVAVMPTIDCLPLFIAADRGMFERHGTEVTLYPYQAQMDCDTAFISGWVDAMATDVVRAERLRVNGVPSHYLTATNLHWQLLAGEHTTIERLGQLQDKMVAMTRFSATALLADQLVDSTNVDGNYVFRVQVNDVGVRLNMLLTQVMDAMLLPEPQAAAARRGNARVLYDTHWNDICMGALVVSGEAMADSVHHRQTEGLLAAYDEACDSINAYGLGAYKLLVARHCGVDAAVADSLAETTFSHAAPPRQQDIDMATRWLKKTDVRE